MNSKILIYLALALNGLLTGCSTIRPVAGPIVFDSKSNEAGAAVVLDGLWPPASFRAEAGSWQALLEKANPAFAWNGRDMMWIEKGTNGQPPWHGWVAGNLGFETCTDSPKVLPNWRA